MTLREWQKERLNELRGQKCLQSRYSGCVTVVIYTFPPHGRESEMFQWIECSILHTWSVLGSLKTIIVSSHDFPAVCEFAATYSNVEVQIAENLISGNIKTMSLDCIKRLHLRFSTPYCLVIQDDGFPLRDNLGDFLGKADFWGAPIISDGWKRRLAYGVGMGSFNGGFSLRSHRLCEHASRKWNSVFRHIFPEDHWLLGEDFYYSTLLKFLPSTWIKFRFPSEQESFHFAFDNLGGAVSLPLDNIKPFGFHGKPTAGLMLSRGCFQETPLHRA